MSNLWIPGAERLTPSSPGGRPLGKRPPRAIWHTTESGTGDKAFVAVAKFLRDKGTEPHALWDPTTGRIGQYFPADRSARAVGNYGLVRCNRTGRVTVQIEVMGRAHESPLKNGPCEGLDKILSWMDSLGISREWPGGYPMPYPKSYGKNGDRSVTKWLTKGGHFAHSQVPGNTHGDPGEIDPAKWAQKKPEEASSRDEDRNPVPTVSLAKVIAAAKKDPGAEQGHLTHKADVLIVEKSLFAESLLAQPYIDGSYGTKTRDAYSAWQRRMGYTGKDADGIPGLSSLARLGKRHGFLVKA